MELNLRNKITCVFGLNNSGKSYFVKNVIIPKYNCLVFDVLGEYPQDICDVYLSKNRNYPAIAQENEDLIKKIVIPGVNKYELLIYEEASRIFPNMRPFYPVMRSFFDTYRHYGELGLVFICRRPAQLQTDIPGLSHCIFSFGNKGSADIQRLNQESEGLGDLVATLSNYEYVFVDQDRSFRRMPKI